MATTSSTFADGANRADTGLIDLESFVGYMGQFSPVSPDLQERALDNSLLGEAVIHWPGSLGDPPAMDQGDSAKFSLDTDLPIELPEDFTFTVEAPDGIEIEYGTPSAGREFPITIEGFPAGESTLPFTVSVGDDVEAGEYELVFTLDRNGVYSVFDGNPLPTPATLTVELTVGDNLPPTGSNTAPLLWSAVVLLLAGGLLVSISARRSRQTA